MYLCVGGIHLKLELFDITDSGLVESDGITMSTIREWPMVNC